MTERKLVSLFVKRLEALTFKSWFYKIPDVPGGTSKRPFDIVGVVAGVPLAIECKKSTGRIAPHQDEALKAFSKAGGVSCVVYLDNPSDFDGVIQNILSKLAGKQIYEAARGERSARDTGV